MMIAAEEVTIRHCRLQAAPLLQEPLIVPRSGPYAFRKSNGTWCIIYNGHSCHVPDRVGLTYIHHLIHERCRDNEKGIHVNDLVAVANPPDKTQLVGKLDGDHLQINNPASDEGSRRIKSTSRSCPVVPPKSCNTKSPSGTMFGGGVPPGVIEVCSQPDVPGV